MSDPWGQGSGGSPFSAPLVRDRRSRLLGGGSGVAISTASTLVVLGAIVLAVMLAPGSATVRHTFFSLSDMKAAFLGDPAKGWFSVGSAFVLNIEMFLAGEAIILILALVIAVVRQQRAPVFFPLRVAATIFVDIFRGIPTLLIVYAIGFGVPALYLRGISDQPTYVYGVAGLVLSYSAYVSEVYRAGLNSVPPSQVAAARSLGLSEWKTLRHVVLPQAVRTVIPPLLNDFIALQKDTALIAVLGTIEANRAAEIYSDTVFNYSGYTVAAVLFLAVTIPMARLTDRLIARDRAARFALGVR
ncbi:MAG TPA: amino acid ABC transporter permease [Acidimicrobiales bacterium]|nr:amino acid ABC transporter permease [Acidimicrobiales bacterium]